MKSRSGLRGLAHTRLAHTLMAAVALAACLGCAGTPEDPESDTYPIESNAEAMEEEEAETTWGDMNR